MIELKNIGGYCSKDDNGFLLNDTSANKINEKHIHIIEALKSELTKVFNEKVHSMYIRGSIARGLSVDHLSDLDAIIVLNEAQTEEETEILKEVEQNLLSLYPFMMDVDLNIVTKDEVLNRATFTMMAFIIKTYSLCVEGEDLSYQISSFKVDAALANEHLVVLEEQLIEARLAFVDNDDEEDIIDCCRWIMKIIVRAGLALVAVAENKYTRDLYPAYLLFAEHYRDQKSNMKQALAYAIDPISNCSELLQFLSKFGEWMKQESDKWLLKYNPQKNRDLPMVKD
ncbi:nucleotidyltransferase domain-containing protein [Cytobacillus purgationiresistens]|uniref:Nucleotidyltransferase n=1 Tax=Cytobacillus purgationiresistens TaxID=863449 RepID=A0ABU0AK83_9BACI|nr:nucleotidyltransferase domain-containing protein [Cytobacillus purgationiresistens]MDQ0271673.1 putative nucleotidyltransferase [Cytobacillus purgationiresistens]